MSQLQEHIGQAVRLSLALSATIGVVWGIQSLRQDFQQQVSYPHPVTTQPIPSQR
ncbi:hypothetical protein [Synechococcus sp. C9]|jgi:negative regulator of sigma E activity|uniref:hypothetical protein n=1 Tax=Synechococcus sp. C9 TaxID=102119 RepID=UPI001FF19EC9|nr:hypothetical protein [Synechococcus sp. C9]